MCYGITEFEIPFYGMCYGITEFEIPFYGMFDGMTHANFGKRHNTHTGHHARTHTHRTLFASNKTNIGNG